MVFLATVVVQHNRIATQLRDEQVGCEIVIKVCGNHRARTRYLDLVEPERRADIFKSLRALVAQHAQFSSLRGFEYHGQIDPSIVVEIDGGDAPAPSRVRNGKWHTLETLAVDIAPQADSGSPGVGERNIHP